MIVQEDDDKRKYESELNKLMANKDKILSQKTAEFEKLKKMKQEL